MTGSQLATRPEANFLPQPSTQKPAHSRFEYEPAVAFDGKVGPCPGPMASGTIGTRRWSCEWAGEDLIEPRLASEEDCKDQTGVLCPKLAEAQAGRVLAERQLIEFNHRLANVLQMLVTRVERQRRLPNDPAKGDEVERLMARINASVQLHRCLLPPRTRMQVDLGSLLANVGAAIEGLTGLLCNVEAESVRVCGQVAMHLAAAVYELAWNAHKHAYSGAEGGVIRITCRRDASAHLLLSVADQGPGLPADFDPRVSEGFGLMIVCATARQFGGKLRVESEPGACFTLLLNIPRVEGGVS